MGCYFVGFHYPPWKYVWHLVGIKYLLIDWLQGKPLFLFCSTFYFEKSDKQRKQSV